MNMNEKREHLLTALFRFRNAFLITYDENNRLDARPMTIVETEKNGVVWFPISKSSVQFQPGTNAYITAQAERSYVVARGAVSLHSDSATIDRLWSTPLEVWFPDGRKDPELAFLRMEIIEGEYWDISGLNRVKYCLSAFTAFLQDTQPIIDDESMHSKVYPIRSSTGTPITSSPRNVNNG